MRLLPIAATCFAVPGPLAFAGSATTGKPQYESKRLPAPAHFGGARVAFDGKLLITSQDGGTHVPGTNSSKENLYRIRQTPGNIQLGK
jgi:hypothetical protein